MPLQGCSQINVKQRKKAPPPPPNTPPPPPQQQRNDDDDGAREVHVYIIYFDDPKFDQE